MIWIIISVICFLLLRNFLSKLEIDDRDGWKPFKALLWLWVIAAIICLVPFINIIGLVCVELLAIADIRSHYPDLRFKEGKSHWFIKLIDFMNKEF
jgi:purine-cytosine permease-like protein